MDLIKARAALDAAQAALTIVEAALAEETPLTEPEAGDLLARVASIVSRVRRCSTYCGPALTSDLEHLEGVLTTIENAHAVTVNDFQDARYRTHNVETFVDAHPTEHLFPTVVPEPDPPAPKMEITGRWYDRNTRKRHLEPE